MEVNCARALVLPENLVGAHYDRLLVGILSISHLQHAMHPNEFATFLLHPHKKDSRSILFRLGDCGWMKERERIFKLWDFEGSAELWLCVGMESRRGSRRSRFSMRCAGTAATQQWDDKWVLSGYLVVVVIINNERPCGALATEIAALMGRLYWNVLPLGISHAMFVNQKSVSSTVDVIMGILGRVRRKIEGDK